MHPRSMSREVLIGWLCLVAYSVARDAVASWFSSTTEAARRPLTPEPVSDRSGVVCRPTEGKQQ